MVRIAVFDSGLGSLSIIKSIQKICKSEIIYFADQKNYPYGKKSKKQLETIINKTIKLLEENFSPDIIVMASNTPSLMVNTNRKIIRVNPPIRKAMTLSKTKNIVILGTQAAIKSKNLSSYIKKINFSKDKKIYKINSSVLVDLVESNKFITDKMYCKKIIKKTLSDIFSNKIDVATLSSTHLSFLKSLLSSEFPKVKFVDSADVVADKVLAKIKKESKKNTIKIFTSGNVKLFEKNLNKLGIKNKVNFLST
jgi:glutamate racemase